jgi:opacity protein-like surface antigen
MKKMLAALAAALVAIPAATNAAVVTVNFNDLPQNTVASTQYSHLGVTFSASENGGAVGTVTGWYDDMLAWSNCFSTFCAQRADVIRMDFSQAVSGLQFLVNTGGNLRPVFNAYNQSGQLLQSVTAAEGINTAVFSATGIAYVEGLQPSDNWGYLVDDLQFNAVSVPAAVPEPASLALFGLGALGLAALRRRNRA